jgi:bacterioferritin
MLKREFINNLNEIRKRALDHMQKGFIVADYHVDQDVIIKILNEALINEVVCVFRYKMHYYTALGIDAAAAKSFHQRAAEEQTYADKISFRIIQLGGKPNYSRAGLAHLDHSQYTPGDELMEMTREDATAEQITIDSFAEMIRFMGDDDIPSCRMMENILEAEKKHAQDKGDFLKTMSPDLLMGVA